jgi:cytochrome c oxidase cbb3-type subunit 1
MAEFMNTSNATLPAVACSEELGIADTFVHRRVVADVAWHALLWLVVANGVGILLAAMLLVPGINTALEPLTYGRWMPVHMNLQLYGWCSLPLVAFLFEVYRCSRTRLAQLTGAVLWLWSTALAIGAVSWLSGHSSGKLFLDWTGYSRILFPLALFGLWCLLTYSFWSECRVRTISIAVKAGKIAGLVLLLLVPALIYIASSPALYPPINPDTGGPTGASQLESTLVIVAILLLLPFGLAKRKMMSQRALSVSWAIFAAECILCLGLGRADISHHRPIQWISLASLLIWVPLMPAYYNAFLWHENARRWRLAFLCWWSILVPTGWTLFLPGVLDHFKFTDGLVAHSLLAMAGFVSSLLIFLFVQLMGDDGWIFNGRGTFYLWQISVAAYVAIMFYAGWREGAEAAFSIVPSAVRNGLYLARLGLGILLFAASVVWFKDAFALFRGIDFAAASAGRCQLP